MRLFGQFLSGIFGGTPSGLPLPLFTEVPRETVWKLLRTGQPPHHQPLHRRVDKGLPSSTQPLVVLAHSTGL
jgi:hypothetical protein